ncbi:hypothetical protein HYPSUDRAFT_201797 [Hypholoma sublateritium FD-334 SS-4]|uniref:Uncharacterized protein n=1 Tax=Hypholoma sublateritium (strain FD-334 SS-4) TaxID=945553 RepID=A0A0D2PTI5_HYPSF|nr:hypothetical protein HYPSUDRAFT_201797 [Hypholoma sublateritium FD-334 SS-4]
MKDTPLHLRYLKLLTLASANTAIIGGMFTASEMAQVAIALSSVTWGLGIARIAWLFTFRSHVVFSTYERASHFFFALSARALLPPVPQHRETKML